MNFRTIAGCIGISVLGLMGCSIGPRAEGHGSYPAASILNVLSISTLHQGSGIDVRGSFAYISMRSIGSRSGARSLVIADLDRPATPTILSTTGSGQTTDMAGIVVSGKYAYVPYEANSGTNFQTWDVSNPYNPSVVGSAEIPCPGGMFPFSNPAVYREYVYISCFESEVTTTGAFAIVSVSNPASPFVVTSIAVTKGYQPISFAISGEYLYVVATQGGSTSDYILLYSLAHPTSPALLAEVSVPHSPQWVAAQGTVAVVPIYDGNELQIIDFLNPSSPQTYAVSLGSCHPMRGTTYQGDWVFAPCDSPGGMAVVNLAKISHPSHPETMLSGTMLNFLAASDRYLYGVDTSGNLQTIDFEP